LKQAVGTISGAQQMFALARGRGLKRHHHRIVRNLLAWIETIQLCLKNNKAGVDFVLSPA
jgi:hypothetical protein